jgi:FKBP-type peptidyl-prolyl cis-trans isomerase
MTEENNSLIKQIKPGSGNKIENGQIAVVHYVGMLEDGFIFDSSRKRDIPFEFPLGDGMVIKGWEEGVLGMQVGEIRKLTIPSYLGYGDYGVPDAGIPGGATLIFEVELVGIK